MKKLLFLFFLINLFYRPGLATTIEASNPNYAGKELVFSKYSDPVTLNEKQLFSIRFDNKGNAKTTFNASETIFVFCDFGIYRGMLFVEPEKTIKLQLPPIREKSFADQKNPFFKPISFWFETNSSLNKNIAAFDLKFNELTNKFINQLYFQQSKSIFDTVTNALNITFSSIENETFNSHKKLKLETLKSDVFRLKTEDISHDFSIEEKYWTTPAFMELFDKLFTNKLSFDVKEIKSTELRNAVAKSNLNYLFSHIKTKYKLSGSMVELVALKMLHDGFYSGDFSKSLIIAMLDSEKFAKSNYENIRDITKSIITKVKFLLPGSLAPVICLKDIDGNTKCSEGTKDKFKYIVFADTEMMVCREHLKYLTTIQNQFKNHLEIVIVLRKTDLIEMKMFLVKNEIPGLKLIDEKGEFINRYKVKSFPTCFILDENHKIAFSEAKAPLDGFEQQFGSFLRNELFERQRNQTR